MRTGLTRVASNIRNFCIIAHIDHGKTTLSDRLLEVTRTVAQREMEAQLLDAMDLERERGITIKMHPVTLDYVARDGERYELNFIDTPGHVDFSSEVSRSLAACEGALLVIDAAQGIEAQTLANYHLALEQNLTIIPVINKIDLPAADPERVKKEIEELLVIEGGDAILASAKEGIGIADILEAIVERVPPPRGSDDYVRGLVFDAQFDPYRGVVSYVRVMDGTLAAGTRFMSMNQRKVYEATEVGVFKPLMRKTRALDVGNVGYVIANIKSLGDIDVGDTLTEAARPAPEPLPGYKPIVPMVYCGLYPNEGVEVSELREALEKLALNDSALHYEPESSIALGFGFRCGFLGMLHMEIVQERLERNYDLDLIATSPSVVFHVSYSDGRTESIDNPAKLPPRDKIALMEEPYVRSTVITPPEYVGAIMELTQNRRGALANMEYLADGRVILTYEMPLIEVIIDYFDALKSRTKGYASLDYEVIGYREGDLVKLEILLNGEPVDALSSIVAREKAASRGRALTEKLKELIPRQMFDVPIQAAIGGKIIARETVSAMRKNVLAKCYGGDITRKRKLLEKQKVGKERMKRVGRVDLPQEAFMAVLRLGDT
ncbi:MAG: elongation factor 4 [Candidatus Eremiobacteraeota bacterium]|nr:elongation factor 4 [Candidatus Eremiobacteraeota bacterium]MBC5803574.1 elongation factor 4 [Candidatus Eremiobacteraeota bacterium]MBC5822765.1 elongation factor 4 [Candidatus Eremiobacteraeota bacterium]